MTSSRLPAIAALGLLLMGGCGDDVGGGSDGDEPAASVDTVLIVTMSRAAAAGADDAAIEACGDLPGVVAVEDHPDGFQFNVRGSSYEEQRDIVICLGRQPGIHGVVGAK